MVTWKLEHGPRARVATEEEGEGGAEARLGEGVLRSKLTAYKCRGCSLHHCFRPLGGKTRSCSRGSHPSLYPPLPPAPTLASPSLPPTPRSRWLQPLTATTYLIKAIVLSVFVTVPRPRRGRGGKGKGATRGGGVKRA